MKEFSKKQKRSKVKKILWAIMLLIIVGFFGKLLEQTNCVSFLAPNTVVMSIINQCIYYVIYGLNFLIIFISIVLSLLFTIVLLFTDL